MEGQFLVSNGVSYFKYIDKGENGEKDRIRFERYALSDDQIHAKKTGEFDVKGEFDIVVIDGITCKTTDNWTFKEVFEKELDEIMNTGDLDDILAACSQPKKEETGDNERVKELVRTKGGEDKEI